MYMRDYRRRTGRESARFHERHFFGLGALALGAMLIVQLIWFEGATWAQNPRLRPVLEDVCGTLGCPLPPFHDVGNLHIIERDLRAVPGGLEFRLVFANSGELPQALPQFRLVLNQLNGTPMAERTFTPSEYLGSMEDGEADLMPVGRPFEIRLLLAKPSADVGGFEIEFL